MTISLMPPGTARGRRQVTLERARSVTPGAPCWAGLVGGAAVGAAHLGPLGALLVALAGAVLGGRRR